MVNSGTARWELPLLRRGLDLYGLGLHFGRMAHTVALKSNGYPLGLGIQYRSGN